MKTAKCKIVSLLLVVSLLITVLLGCSPGDGGENEVRTPSANKGDQGSETAKSRVVKSYKEVIPFIYDDAGPFREGLRL